jgi:hypothetical protein
MGAIPGVKPAGRIGALGTDAAGGLELADWFFTWKALSLARESSLLANVWSSLRVL